VAKVKDIKFWGSSLMHEQIFMMDVWNLYFERTGRFMWCDNFMREKQVTEVFRKLGEVLSEGFNQVREVFQQIGEQVEEVRACYYDQYCQHPAINGSSQYTLEQREHRVFRQMYAERIIQQHQTAATRRHAIFFGSKQLRRLNRRHV